MDRTTNESKKVYDYISRYTKFPYYYQELDQKYFEIAKKRILGEKDE